MAESNASAEYNLDENLKVRAMKIQKIRSIVPDSDPNSSDIEVLLVWSSEVSGHHTEFEDELDDNGPNTVNDATVTTNGTFLTGQLTSLT